MASDKKIENPVFIQRLKALMKEKGYTQQSLSDYSKVMKMPFTRTTVSLWCIGRSYPTRENLQFLCETLGVSSEYLLGETNFRNKDEMFEEWNKRVSKDTVNNVKKIEALEKYLVSIGIKLSQSTESTEYTYKDLTVEYIGCENEELFKSIETAIKNLIF